MPEVTVAIETADRVNANGRRYPRRLLARLMAEHEPDKTLAYVHSPGAEGPTLDNAVGSVKDLELKADGKLYATVELFRNTVGSGITELLKHGFHPKFKMSGIGTVGADGMVADDYQLNGLQIDMGPVWQNNKLREVLLRKMQRKLETDSPPPNPLLGPGDLR